MNAVPTREELFEMAARPIGSPALQELAERTSVGRLGPTGEVVKGAPPELLEVSKRASKVWLPAGKSSANTTAAREAEAQIKARNFDLEDAIEAAGGRRGHA